MRDCLWGIQDAPFQDERAVGHHFARPFDFVLVLARTCSLRFFSSAALFSLSFCSMEGRSCIVLPRSLSFHVEELSLVSREAGPDRDSFFGWCPSCGVFSGACRSDPAGTYCIRSKIMFTRSISVVGIRTSTIAWGLSLS